PVTQAGAYRLEATIQVDGEDRPWIATNPLYLLQPRSDLLASPPAAIAANVQVFRKLPYSEGKPEDANEHTLDLYVPKDKKVFPVLLFLHGDLWRSGDRTRFTAFGNRFARAGLGVAIPGYRSAPAPAQIEDAAAAFAWVRKFILKYGGDPHRIYVGGHSLGGRLAALLALDPQYLKPHGLSPADIKGVVALSGLYDARDIAALGPGDETKRDATPSFRVRTASPPFLIAYCQWDYPALPYRARQLYSALRKTFVAARLLYVPGENHLSEIVYVWRDDDPIARAILQMAHPLP
ncbi:MAG: alpha/beta hydrolase, partial [Bryobacteraceae bacterium]